MKRKHHNTLKYIYDRNEVPFRSIVGHVARVNGDHRDFYPLAGLVLEGFVGFTGPVPSGSSEGLAHQEAYNLSRVFQAYSQGVGNQSYDNVTIMGKGEDSHLFIAAKGLLYFHERSEKRRQWWTAAGLSLAGAIIAGCITGLLAAKFWLH
ncbi:hypothetical protein [Pseudomonas fluorescens]|uniref:hypothetical protein n=1 Tax=Pseudomonas fluorescens TaxID=294 RepID=UPI003CFF589A